MAKLIVRRGMIDPKEFDAPTIGGVVSDVKDVISEKLDDAAAEANSAKQRLDISLDRNKPKPTDFDENPPEKKKSFGSKVRDILDQGPATPYPDATIEPQIETESENKVIIRPEAEVSPYVRTPSSFGGSSTGSGKTSTGGSGSGGNIPPKKPPYANVGYDENEWKKQDEKTKGPGKPEDTRTFSDKLYDATLGNVEKGLGIDQDSIRKYKGASVRTTDRLAELGGYTGDSYNSLVDEKRVIKEDYDKAKKEHDDIFNEVKEHEDAISNWKRNSKNWDEILNELRGKQTRYTAAKEAYRKDPIKNSDPDDPNSPGYNKENIWTEEDGRYYDAILAERSEAKRKFDDAQVKLNYLNQRYTRLKYTKDELKSRMDDVNKKFTKYDFALAKGAELDKEKHNWRNEWARPIAENTSNMLSRPVIGNVTDVVGYGQMTGKSAIEGMNAITGGYKTASGANEWTRTRVGDRQLVESLVNVRPSNMITPFGAPGTVGESSLNRQFEYTTPLRKIAVSDVTARPGYILNIEDIHRKKKAASPKAIRGKIDAIKKLHAAKKAKQKVPVPKDINKQLGIQKYKLQRPDITGKSIVGGYAISPLTRNKFDGNMKPDISGMTKVSKSSIYITKSNGMVMPKFAAIAVRQNLPKNNVIDVQGKMQNMKSITMNTKPFKLNMEGVNATTPKMLEVNLNLASLTMKKRKLVKV